MSYNPAENAVLLCTVSISQSNHVNPLMIYYIVSVFHMFDVMLFTSCRGRPTWRTAHMTCTLFPKKVTLRTQMVKKQLTKVLLFSSTFALHTVNYLSLILYLFLLIMCSYMSRLAFYFIIAVCDTVRCL